MLNVSWEWATNCYLSNHASLDVNSHYCVILTLVQTDCISFDPQFGFSTRQLWLRKQSGFYTKVIPQLLQPKLFLMSVCDDVRQGAEKQFLYSSTLRAEECYKSVSPFKPWMKESFVQVEKTNYTPAFATLSNSWFIPLGCSNKMCTSSNYLFL